MWFMSYIIKPYAISVITTRRAIDSDNLMVVGTPEWSQRAVPGLHSIHEIILGVKCYNFFSRSFFAFSNSFSVNSPFSFSSPNFSI